MVTNETVSKLQDMHLSTMARRFKEQLDNPQMKELSFEVRFGLLVDAEWTTRKNNHLARLIKKAGYAIPGACMEDIEYLPERKLDKAQLTRLTSCSYIQESHNIVLLGATGAGKTYIACALSMAASRSFYTVRYIRLPDLLVEIAIARGEGTYREYMKKFKKIKLLILDECCSIRSRRAKQGMYWNWSRHEPRPRPLSSVPRWMSLAGMRICMIQRWRMLSVTALSMIPM